jgi:hypothetical protein
MIILKAVFWFATLVIVPLTIIVVLSACHVSRRADEHFEEMMEEYKNE